MKIVRILPYFSGDDTPRKSNLDGEDDGLKPKKQIKVKRFSFQAIASFFFRSMNKIQFLFNKDLFLKIKRFRILLDHPNMIDQNSSSIQCQDHLIVQIGVVL